MFISPAYAQAAGGTPGGDIISMILPLVMIMGVFWFLLIRPQQKRLKDHQELVKNVRRGDTVVTGGGIVGRGQKGVDEKETMRKSPNNAPLRVLKPSIAGVPPRGEPVKEE